MALIGYDSRTTTPSGSEPLVLTPRQARVLAWQSGHLEYLCRERPLQVEIYNQIRDSWAAGEQTFCLVIHRQFGKSRMLCVLSLEECLRAGNTNVIYVCDTKTHAEAIVIPLIAQLLEEAPKHLRPTYSRERRTFEFPNKSTLSIYGIDFDGLDKVRGVRARFVAVDEAAFQPLIKETLAVVLPVLSTTSGFCVMATTPPSVPGHPFMDVYAALRDLGHVRVIPLDENPDANPAMRRAADQYRKLLGEAAYRREWQCDMSGVGDDTVVLPEWPAVRASVVKQLQDLPPRADHYIGYDIGGRDWDAFCFGTWDHVAGRFVVQGEVFLRAASIADMAEKVKAKIAALGWDKDGGRLYMFSDHNNAHLINEFRRTYDLNFLPTKKPEKVAQIHEVRQLLNDGELVFDTSRDPLAALIRTCERARWDRTHKGFLRAETADIEKSGQLPIGHSDMLDALVYCVVNVRRFLAHEEPRKPSTMERRYGARLAPHLEPAPMTRGGRVSDQARNLARSLHSMLTGRSS